MMSLLHLLSYLGGLTAFLFVTLSLASGLLWLAELIEEHSRYAKTVGVRSIYAIIILHALLFITDGLPFLPIVFSIFCHVVYLQNFSSAWPFISLISPRFLLSCVLVVIDHFIWFFHFAAVAEEAKKYRAAKYRYSAQAALVHKEAPTFLDVAAFFSICVWFVPLFLFLSLSANDNVIPSFENSAPPSPMNGAIDISASPLDIPKSTYRHASRSSSSLVKSVLVPIVNLLPRLRRKQRDAEGIIAPRTPVRGSPVQQPPSTQQSYFPVWGSDVTTPAPGPSAYPTGLGPESASRNSNPTPHRFTPPPPRRVASENQSRSSSFSRPTSAVTSSEEEMLGITPIGIGSAGRKSPVRRGSVGHVGEIVETGTKSKAD